MTLLLNYRPVLRQPTGIGVYANAVLPALQAFPHKLLVGGDEGSSQQRLQRFAWSQLQLPRLATQNRASLIFTPAPEGYLGPQCIPQVVMVHDLRPISHPERSLQSLYFRSWVPPLLRSCRHVLTNSQFTAREIQRWTGIADEKITVTPLGYDEQVFKPGLLTPASLQAPYFLHIGQAYHHKNLRRVISAFAEIARTHLDLRLLLVGKPHKTETPALCTLVKELGLKSRVEFRPYVPYVELPGLYRGALALVYPSLWEGFGLPILEAMACGTPVITSMGSGCEEVSGKAAILVNPSSVEEILEAMREVLARGASVYSPKSLQRAADFSWERVRLTTSRVIAAAA